MHYGLAVMGLELNNGSNGHDSSILHKILVMIKIKSFQFLGNALSKSVMKMLF